MIVLGIETSCDETGAGIVRVESDGALTLLADEVASSVAEHVRFGGVVPEIAARAHLEAIRPTVRRALETAQIDKPDAVAVTIGPGLIGPLSIGVSAAKAYALAWGVPLYAVNHLGGHIAVDQLEHGPLPRAVALLVSGGHTQILKAESLVEPLVELGATVDDAAGEAFDKVARLLGLGYPGGPVVDKLAQTGDPSAVKFPRPMTGPKDARYDFSFSGLKTAVIRYLQANPDHVKADVAAGFQEATADVLTAKAVAAAKEHGATTLVLGGGACANSRIRALAEERCAAAGIELRVPKPRLCTDNGAMIAAFGAGFAAAGAKPSSLDVGPNPGLNVGVSLL